MATVSAIPLIDTDLKFVGVSKLRDLNATKLREDTRTTYVFQDNDQPLAVLLSYDRYLTMQHQLEGIIGLVEMLTDENERDGVLTGLSDVAAGRTKPFSRIKSALKETNDGPAKKR
jgi:PHD/YefM family antitoxin component YafN of YafNO toxin-antitoxin module